MDPSPPYEVEPDSSPGKCPASSEYAAPPKPVDVDRRGARHCHARERLLRCIIRWNITHQRWYFKL